MAGAMPQLMIGSRPVGGGAACLVIAEAGVNHDGDVGRAHALIDAAAAAHADVIKFQTFSADLLASAEAPKAGYQHQGAHDSESQREMLRRLELPPECYSELIAHAGEAGLIFLSTPFDDRAADLLESLEIPAFKVSSGDLTNLPFLRRLARKRRPLLLSTGMSTLAEVALAVDAVREEGSHDFALLHCVSDYPARPSDVNLRAMLTLGDAFGCVVGYSDHTLGSEIALAAVALGAQILEKHVTLDRLLPGPDHSASLEPGDLNELVSAVRRVEAALGDGRKVPAVSEAATAAVARKSLVAACDLPEGTRLTNDMLKAIRPGTGISPAALSLVEGRTLRKPVAQGELLSWDDLR